MSNTKNQQIEDLKKDNTVLKEKIEAREAIIEKQNFEIERLKTTLNHINLISII